MNKPTTAEVARFFDKVKITKHCWLWIRGINSGGYGVFEFHDNSLRAHRFSYELFVGPIKPGYCILHRRECGNRNCVNPHHLYMGTRADNARDREIWGNRLLNRFSKETGGSVLTTGKRIRQLRIDRKLSQKQLAEKLGVSRQAVNGWENDKGLPYWTNLGQLADLFGVSIKFLLYGENNKGGKTDE